ncbi:hypothetical protein WMF39_01495 [Sorangium sp. So ce1504]|uniref:hypothetical protein n=1 Tax=Sorangium sp. So ce1504 TaxID=3133337 RepID=UPI003F61290E
MTNDMMVRIELKRRIDRDLDELYKEANSLGEEMGKLFTSFNRSQLRNLETVAAAATRTSALKNHVKNQTGKDRLRPTNQTWALQCGAKSLGEKLLALLDALGGRATSIVSALPLGDLDQEARDELARTVEIELQRGVVQTAVCAALYEA